MSEEVKDNKTEDVVVEETKQETNQETNEVKVDATRTPEQIEKDIRSAFKSNETVVDDEIEIEKGDKKVETKVEETKTYNPIWDKIKGEFEQQNGEGSFKMPEFEPEKEYDVLLDFLAKSLQPSYDDIPEEAKEIIELHKQGIYDPEKYAAEREQLHSIMTMPADDLLFDIYKTNYGKSEQNPKGYEDDDIKEYISKMSKIAKDQEANAARIEIRKQFGDIEAKKKIHQVSREKQIEELNAQKKELSKKLIEANKENTEFFGIQASKAEIDEYQKVFPDLVKLDPETGTSKLIDWLQSDQTLYQLGFLFHKGSDYVKALIAKEKKEVKETIEEKLGTKADLEKTGLDQTKVRTFDINKFKGNG